MRFVCDSCRAQYMISDEKVGAKGVKVRCKKCGYVILVRKAEAAPAPPPPADFNDSTQIMSNPLANQGGGAAGSSFDSEMTQLGTPRDNSTQALGEESGGGKGVLASVEDDEIGAVFDQVLRTGPNPIPQEGASSEAALGDDDDDDRLSTRVLDQETVKKLAEESGMAVFGASPTKESNGKKTDKALAQDWFVAIDEKQTGPLTVEKLKDLWDRGEIGPDSLCWRAGFSDWMPLSEVAELASELAPKPSRPVLAGPAPSAGAVVTVPVESAFTAGGMTKTVRSEMQMLASAPVEETGGWKPSAASALASLVKEEIDAMAKPATPAPNPSPSRGGGLLDLPDTGSTSVPNGKPGTDVAMRNSGGGLQQPPSSMVDPYNNAPSPYAAPYGQYAPSAPPPPQGLSRGLTVGLIVAGVAVLSLVGLVLFLVIGKSASQQQAEAPATTVTPSGAMAAKSTPAAAAPQSAESAKKLDMPPPPTAPNGQPLPPNPKAEPPAAASPPPSAAARADRAERAAERAIEKAERPRETKVAKADRGSRSDEEGETFGGKEPAEKKKPVAEPSGDDDEFNSMFGGGSSNGSKKKETSDEQPKTNKKQGYIPPAPGAGAGEVESLSSSDIMTVVVQNKPAIMKCVAEQKNKDPDMTGTLVMRWQVQPTGRTSNVSVQSDEFKSTYMASCIGGLIKGWQFPRHKVAGDPINFPFKF